jgi:uncharacterized protein
MKSIKLLTALFLISLIFIPAYAQGTQPPLPASPPNGTYIHDELNWLTDEQEASINSMVASLDGAGLSEIAVVTLDDCGTDKLSFRKSLFDTWGIGHADDNDGLLILVCWYGGDKSRRSVEQLYGPGLNGILSPNRTDQIARDYFIPAFEQDNPGEGLVDMVRAYKDLIRKASGPADILYTISLFFENMNPNLKTFLLAGLIIAAFFVIDRFMPKSLRRRYEHWLSSGNSKGDGFGGGSSDGGGGSSTRF